jgi:beta-fructofuranosidase
MASFANDLHRPHYHFLPEENWLNDPNGLIQWQGKTHMFYQYNPRGPFHGTIHWGHAVSEDLVHWKHLPVALTPTPGGPDEGGCWSGCAVNNGGTPTFIYSGHRHHQERPCLAFGSDDLVTWEKYPGNPVIPDTPEGLELVGFRDHCVWWEGETWYQAIGAGIKDVGGTVFLYRSPDLIRWEYLNPILIGDHHQTEPVWTGTMWECPDFFPLGHKHVLLISVWAERQTRYTAYFVGDYRDYQFKPEHLQKLDYGDIHFYAPQKLFDQQGRCLLWGWSQEGRSPKAQMAAGWSGVMSLPRVLSLSEAGELRMAPAAEIQRLRGQHYQRAGVELKSGEEELLTDIQGDCLEIIAEFEAEDPETAPEFGIKLRCSPDGEEETLISYTRGTLELVIDRSRSSLDPEVYRSLDAGPLNLQPGEGLRLHIFLDRSIIEIFANERACLTSRVYPTRPDSLGLALFARGGKAVLKSLEVWKMAGIWGG